VRDHFRDLLSDGPEAKSRIDFEPWFVHQRGLVFVEHGHQYDPFCVTPYLLAPLSPVEPNRVIESLSDTLLRFIVRRTPGMKEYGHENRGLWSYVSWGLSLGLRGTKKLFWHFYSAVRRLRGIARAFGSEAGQRLRAEHHRRVDERAEKMGFARDDLHAALSLHVVPMGLSPRGVLTSVMLDRLLMLAVAVPTLIALLALWPVVPFAPYIIGALVLVCVVLNTHFARLRPNVDPAAVMIERAKDLAKLFPASFIVMGHTHFPISKSVGESTTYINLGAWAEEEPDPSEKKPYRSPRTHLVIHAKEDRHEAHLMEWRSNEGPHPINVMIRPLASDAVVVAETSVSDSAASEKIAS